MILIVWCLQLDDVWCGQIESFSSVHVTCTVWGTCCYCTDWIHPTSSCLISITVSTLHHVLTWPHCSKFPLVWTCSISLHYRGSSSPPSPRCGAGLWMSCYATRSDLNTDRQGAESAVWLQLKWHQRVEETVAHPRIRSCCGRWRLRRMTPVVTWARSCHKCNFRPGYSHRGHCRHQNNLIIHWQTRRLSQPGPGKLVKMCYSPTRRAWILELCLQPCEVNPLKLTSMPAANVSLFTQAD